MNTVDTIKRKMSRDELNAYWTELSRRHLEKSEAGFEVICFAGMPAWFNGFMHRYQLRAFRRLIQGQSFEGSAVLDIGTGVGRWARWFSRWNGARVTGIDIEPSRLARAASYGGDIRYEMMSADQLAFDDATFDVVNSVTVLQHVDGATKTRAIAEIARVLRPGGRLVLFEVTDVTDDAPHVFPWTDAQWTRALREHGLSVERRVGEQYIPLLRLAKSALRTAQGGDARNTIDALKAGRGRPADRLAMTALRAAVIASYPAEELCRFLPSRYARITGLLCTARG